MTQTAIIDDLIARHGEPQAARIRRGVEQVAQRWWPEDGGADALAAFCAANFLADPDALAATFQRLEKVLEQVDGHLHEVRRELTDPSRGRDRTDLHRRTASSPTWTSRPTWTRTSSAPGWPFSPSSTSPCTPCGSGWRRGPRGTGRPGRGRG